MESLEVNLEKIKEILTSSEISIEGLNEEVGELRLRNKNWETIKEVDLLISRF